MAFTAIWRSAAGRRPSQNDRTGAGACAGVCQAGRRGREGAADAGAIGQAMLDAGLARILMPERFGGYGLDFETWYDVVWNQQGRARTAGARACSSSRPSDRAISRRMPAGDLGRRPRCRDRGIVCAADQAVRGARRLSADRTTMSRRQRRRPQHWVMIGAMVQTLRAGVGAVHGAAWRLHGARHSGSPPACAPPAATPSSPTTCSCRARGCCACRTCASARARARRSTVTRSFARRSSSMRRFVLRRPMLGAAQGAYAHFRERTKGRGRRLAGAEKMSAQVRHGGAAPTSTLPTCCCGARRGRYAPEAEISRRCWRARSATSRASDFRSGHRHADGVERYRPAFRHRSRSSAPGATSISPRPTSASTPRPNYCHFGRTEFGLPRDPNRRSSKSPASQERFSQEGPDVRRLA